MTDHCSPERGVALNEGLRACLGRLLGAIVVLAASGAARADEGTAPDVEPAGQAETCCPPQRSTLTGGWFGEGEVLSEKGIDVSLSVTQLYQLCGNGGLATHRHAGRWAGSYDLELNFDLERLAHLRGLSAYVAAEGSWSEGIDASSVGSLFAANADAGGDQAVQVSELYFEQALLDGRLLVRVGKLDLSGGFECADCPVAFDTNAFANDETMQFANGALGNNPTIPFPDNGLGLAVYLQPTDWWYLAAGAADAQADARETGFNTAFHDEDYFFSIFETGVVPQLPSTRGPLQGAYRVGFWYDPQAKDRLNGNGAERDDLGLYLSMDQVLWRESAEDDGQGLGMFARLGWADNDLNPVKSFWSVGAQYQGLLPGRDDDVLGLGFAQGRLSRDGGGLTDSHETVMELYYNAQVTPWLSISPGIQYIWNPGGAGTADAFVAGVRVQLAF